LQVQSAGEADAVFYFPLDVPLAIWRALNAVRPHAFLTMETELWPTFLHMCKASGAKTFLVNGRVSDNLLRRAPQMGRLWHWMMSNLDGLLMRSATDAQRIEQLGAPAAHVHVTGDVKLDAATSCRTVGTAHSLADKTECARRRAVFSRGFDARR
jgi:3-deoxy-D-manno-octulosonic-acid transferase